MRKFYKAHPIGIIYLFSVMILLSCSTARVKFKTFPEQKETLYKDSSQITGLKVFHKPVLSGSEAKTYFGTNLIEKNILAMYVSVFNESTNKSFIMSEDSLKLLQLENVRAKNSPEKASDNAEIIGLGAGLSAQAATTAMVAATIPAATGLSILFPIAQLPIAIAEAKRSLEIVINDNFETQRFKVTTLEPGEKESGFIYFDWNKLKGHEGVIFCFNLQEAISNDIFQHCSYVSLQETKN